MDIIVKVKDLKESFPQEYENLKKRVNHKNSPSTTIWDAWFMDEETLEEERWHRVVAAPIESEEELIKLFDETGTVVYQIDSEWIFKTVYIEIEVYQDIYVWTQDEVLFEEEVKSDEKFIEKLKKLGKKGER